MPRRSAIIWLLSPSATRVRVSRSRWLSDSSTPLPGSTPRRKASIRRAAMRWCSTASPLAALRKASARASASTSLSRQERAPAWTAETICWTSSNEVSNTTWVSGLAARIARVASMPPPGMTRSTRATSGFCRLHCSTAEAESLASPTMDRSACVSRKARMPWRTRSWSSAMTMRMGLLILVPRS